jgi:hypothetical protein
MLVTTPAEKRCEFTKNNHKMTCYHITRAPRPCTPALWPAILAMLCQACPCVPSLWGPSWDAPTIRVGGSGQRCEKCKGQSWIPAAQSNGVAQHSSAEPALSSVQILPSQGDAAALPHSKRSAIALHGTAIMLDCGGAGWQCKLPTRTGGNAGFARRFPPIEQSGGNGLPTPARIDHSSTARRFKRPIRHLTTLRDPRQTGGGIGPACRLPPAACRLPPAAGPPHEPMVTWANTRGGPSGN